MDVDHGGLICCTCTATAGSRPILLLCNANEFRSRTLSLFVQRSALYVYRTVLHCMDNLITLVGIRTVSEFKHTRSLVVSVLLQKTAEYFLDETQDKLACYRCNRICRRWALFPRGSFLEGGLLSGGSFARGDFSPGVFCPGALLAGGTFGRGDFCPGGLLFGGGFVRGVFCPGGLFPGVFWPGGIFVREGFRPGGLLPGGTFVWGAYARSTQVQCLYAPSRLSVPSILA